MKVIFCNDDFGLTYGFTRGIYDCFTKGFTTSTSICVNGDAYKYGLKLLKKIKKANVGIHLNISYGRTTTKQLQNKHGGYKYSFIKYLIFLKLNKSLLESIELDLDYQFNKTLSDKIKITFVNGHDHFYMIPQIFKIVCKLCKKYKIKYVRLPREPYYTVGNIVRDLKKIISLNILKFIILNKFAKINYDTIKEFNLKTTDAFYGILHTQHMNESTIIAALQDAKKRNFKVIEILGHPSNVGDKRDKHYHTPIFEKFATSYERKVERSAFQSEEIKKFLINEKIKTIPFNKF